MKKNIWIIFCCVTNLQLQDDAEACKTTYEALNSQLVEELPKLLDIGLYIYTTSFNEFIKNRKRLVGRITKELLDLMDVSSKKTWNI